MEILVLGAFIHILSDYSAFFNASTISIFLFFRATINPTASDMPKVTKMLTQ